MCYADSVKDIQGQQGFWLLIWAFLFLGFVGLSFSCYGLGVVSIEGFFFVSGVF